VDVAALAGDNAAFALSLYRRLSRESGNIVFSPFGISAAMGMVYAGARGNTGKEIAAALRFSLGQARLHQAFEMLESRLKTMERDGILLRMASSLWPQEGCPFLEGFVSLVVRHYGAQVTPLDYRGACESALPAINRWVESRTGGRITGLLQSNDLSSLTRLVLVNAVCFKGSWANRFDAGNTKQEPFLVSPGKQVPAPMMAGRVECGHASLPRMDILELPYAGGGLSMVLLLPKRADGLSEVERELSEGGLPEWLKTLHGEEVQVFLPRFRATCRFGLKDVLVSMGMVDAFSDAKADFSGMDGRPDWLYIGAAIHKAFIEVNEEGTEAAAATAGVMASRCVPAGPPVFRADHPFLFLILERGTGSILFAGRLADPGERGR
jgi:serpin B